MHGLSKAPKTIKSITMKKRNIQQLLIRIRLFIILATCAAITTTSLMAQDSTSTPAAKKVSVVKNTFGGNNLIDNQTVMVPIKGTFEFDINHRFGTTDKGFKDLFGLFSTANTRLGFYYVPVKDVQVGFGANNYNMIVDFNLKFAILKQNTDNSMPVSVTYYGNAAMDTRAKNSALPIVNTSDRFSYFNQIMVARKVTEALSVQASFNYTHFNNVDGYYDKTDPTLILPTLNNDHLSYSLSARYKIAPKTAIMFNYDQPLTQHPLNNPRPNLSLGLDMNSSGHGFQVFFGNYGYTLPQYNHMFNQNDYTAGQYVIGFNITRLWNF
ncbi:MAG: hypothetical protein FD136_205 [Chitinophagaceae bacterium]|nr:MAG: hypothetical protein FD183_397 [Chitinophagaceae bacterium]TXT34616.1 MAG: hypothetical protein FD136_205 [Chitinophagaceae bacterium]